LSFCPRARWPPEAGLIGRLVLPANKVHAHKGVRTAAFLSDRRKGFFGQRRGCRSAPQSLDYPDNSRFLLNGESRLALR